ncbi:MAG: hypothetical protein JXA33_07890 [Anaerolineae bacterium]|nr:hypothetical protein [Anaerolineae bacterium]
MEVEKWGEAMQCERCGRLVGPELLACPQREYGACPYNIEKGHGGPLGIGLGLFILAVSLSFTGGPLTILITCMAGADLSDLLSFIPILLVALLFNGTAIAAAVVGLYFAFGTQTTLTHKTTGQQWRRGTLFGIPISQVTTTEVHTLSLKVSRATRYPASISALFHSQDAYHIFYITLLSLISQDAVKLHYTLANRRILLFRAQQIPLFSLTPGEEPTTSLGALETHILQALHKPPEWAKTQILQQFFSLRIMPQITPEDNGLNVRDILRNIAGDSKNNPERWLAMDIVGQDAHAYELGYVTQHGWRKKFEPASSHQAGILAEYDILHQLDEHFQAIHPRLAQRLQTDIKKAFMALKPSD